MGVGLVGGWGGVSSGGGGTDPVQTGDDLSWTVINGSVTGGSALEVSGTVTLTHAANQTSTYIHGAYTGPRAYATFLPRDSTRWSIMGRLTASGGANTGSRCAFGLMQTAGTNEPTRLVVCAPGLGGNVTYNQAGGTNYQSIPGNTMVATGTGWYKITRTGGTLTYEYGTGTTSEPPAAWATIAVEQINLYNLSADHTVAESNPGLTIVLAFSQPTNAPGTAPVCVWSNIRVYDL